MARFVEESDRGEALFWWTRAYSVLSEMKQSGILLRLDEKRLNFVEKKVGRS